MEMSAESASIYASSRKSEWQEGGTAHGVAVPLTGGVEASFRFSKGACLSFVETDTAGDQS